MIEIATTPERGGTLHFERLSDAIVSVSDELETWRFLANEAAIADPNSAIWAPARAWATLAEQLDRLRRNNMRSDDDFRHEDDSLVTRDSLVGQSLQFALQKAGSIGVIAAAGSLNFQGSTVSWANTEGLAGIIALDRRMRELSEKATADQNQITSASERDAGQRLARLLGESKAITTNIEKMRDELQSLQAEAATQLKFLSDQSAEQIITLQREVEASSSLLKDAQGDHHDRITAALHDGDVKIKSWIASLQEGTRLEAPVKLWRERAAGHKSTASDGWLTLVAVGINGLLATACVTVGAFRLAESLFAGAARWPATPGGAKGLLTAGGALRPSFHFELLFTSASSLIWLTMFFWLIRLLVRSYTTEQHLAIDAESRAAMAQTYLALTKENLASDADRAIILGALFRPVADGMVRDEGPPAVSIPALAAAMASGKPA